MASARAQVAVETVIAFLGVLLLLLFVYLQLGNFNEAARFSAEDSRQAIECTKLQSAISAVLATQGNASIETTLYFDANITGSTISFQKSFCYIEGTHINSELSSGTVLVEKIGGVIFVENI
ncbi:MAG: hypothetical protein NUV67_06280 [archaeon]|nr:hypothetical protein [archaeon]